MKRLILTTGLVFSVFLVAACSGKKPEQDGPLAIEEVELGPKSKDLLQDLPDDLSGDRAKARYTSEILQGEDEDGK
ncbi:MAG: hypothetical protein V3R20_01420 [Sphingomonadales bacterium]